MRRPILSAAKPADTWLSAAPAAPEDRFGRFLWRPLGAAARIVLVLPILACLLVAWVLAAILAASWMAIAFVGRNDPLDFDE